MPNHLKETMKLEDQEEYCNAVVAGLEAAAELTATGAAWDAASASEPWLKMMQDLRAERDARDAARFARARKGTRVHVLDAIHDAASKHFAGAVLLASDRKTSQPPYSKLYGEASASEINRLGPDREIAAARVILEKARAFGLPELESALAAYASATDRLEKAVEERDAAELALRPFEIRRGQFIEAIDLRIEEAEGLLRKSFPGNGDLVRAILVPDRDERRSSKKQSGSPEAEPPA